MFYYGMNGSAVVYGFVLLRLNQRVGKSLSTLGAYAPRQGILSTFVSFDAGVVNGYLVGFFFKTLQH